MDDYRCLSCRSTAARELKRVPAGLSPGWYCSRCRPEPAGSVPGWPHIPPLDEVEFHYRWAGPAVLNPEPEGAAE